MKRFRFAAIAVALLSAALLAAQTPAKRPVKVDDMHAFHDVRDVQISPDGKWVAYTVSSVDVAADKSDTDVWMVGWDGKQQLRLTSSPESENAPRWSPDGRYLSFLSGRAGKASALAIWLGPRVERASCVRHRRSLDTTSGKRRSISMQRTFVGN